MPIITSIKPQKNQKRINIYLDGKFGFGLDLENFVMLGLKVGQEISREKIEEIVKKAEFQKILDRLLVFATLRPRSIKEINDWFYRKKVHDSMKNELFNRLKRLDLVDDTSFAKWWIGQRLQFKYKSKRELALELRNKGIDKEIIDQLISELVKEGNEELNAKMLLEKRMYKWERLDKLTKRKKMGEFLARKGFDWETIKKAIGGLDD
jgi:regulatory protein